MTASSVETSDGVAPLAPVYVEAANLKPLLRRYRLGLALFCSAIVMVFVAFSSAYVVRRGIPNYDLATSTYSTTWEPLPVPSGLLVVGAALLLGASGTLEMTRRTGRGVPGFVILATVFVLGFAGVLDAVWRQLRSSGHFMSSGAPAAFFYLLTGAHAVLALSGFVALALISVRQRSWSDARRTLAIDLSTWYMHFVVLLWIYVALFLLFA